MSGNCLYSCPTCGYKLTQVTSRCPRCSTYLLDVFKCSGNCSRCGKHDKPDKKAKNKK